MQKVEKIYKRMIELELSKTAVYLQKEGVLKEDCFRVDNEKLVLRDFMFDYITESIFNHVDENPQLYMILANRTKQHYRIIGKFPVLFSSFLIENGNERVIEIESKVYIYVK